MATEGSADLNSSEGRATALAGVLNSMRTESRNPGHAVAWSLAAIAIAIFDAGRSKAEL